MKDRFKEATRLAILESAEKVFARDGIERARVDAIARDAGVSVGSIYNHIGDRDALFEAVRDLRRQEILETLDAALDEAAERGTAAELETLARTMLDHVERHRGFFAIVLESAERPGRLAQPPETVLAIHARVKSILARGVRSGALRKDLDRHYGALFVGMLRSAMRERITEARGPSAAVWSKTIVTLFLDGAATRRSR